MKTASVVSGFSRTHAGFSRTVLAALTAALVASPAMAQTKAAPAPKGNPADAAAVQRVEARGGYVVRDRDGSISEVSLARTWATDEDVNYVARIKSLKRLDLSFTLVTDKGIKQLEQLRQ